MKTKSLKILVSSLLAVVMLMSFVSVSAMAATFNDDGNVTSTSFTLNNFAFGEMVASVRASCNDNGIAAVEYTKLLECNHETPTGPDDFINTADVWLQAGKQYYCTVTFAEHVDLTDIYGGIQFASPFSAHLNCNGTELTPIYTLVANDRSRVYYYKLPVLEALPHAIDVTTVVEQGGDVAPTTGAFELEILNIEEDSNLPIDAFTIAGKEINTDGKGSFDSKLTIVNNDYEKLFYLLYNGIVVRQKQGTAEGWTYDDTVWFVAFHQDPVVNSLDDEVETLTGFTFDCVKGKLVDGEFVADGNEVFDKVTFTNTYTENTPVIPPETDDNGAGLWIALLSVSVLGVAAATVIGKKKTVR